MENFTTDDIVGARKLDLELTQSIGGAELSYFRIDVGSHVFLSNLQRDTPTSEPSLSTQINLSVLKTVRKQAFPLCTKTQHCNTTIVENKSMSEEEENVDAIQETENEATVVAHRTTDIPTNEFSENDVLFVETFPHLFPLGKGMPFKGSIPQDYVKHLLGQGTNQFAEDAAFVFTVCDQIRRHQTVRSVNCRAKRNPRSMEQFATLTKDPGYAQKVDAAVNNPEGKEAREVLKGFQHFLDLGGAPVPYSSFESASGVSKVYAMSQFHGCLNVYMTISVDDSHSALALRLCVPVKSTNANADFPASDAGFLEALSQGESLFEEKIPIGNAELMKMINANPVAAVLFFKHLIEAVYECLLRILPDRLTRRTQVLSKRGVGIFGRVPAAMHAVEPQGRQTLHAHFAIWGGLPSSLLQKGAMFPKIREAISKVMDLTYSASIPSNHHMQYLTKLLTPWQQRLAPHPLRMTYEAPVVPSEAGITTVETLKQYMTRIYNIMSRIGMHEHRSICHQGKSGQKGCRLAMEQPLQPKTLVVELEANQPEQSGVANSTKENNSLCHARATEIQRRKAFTKLERDYSKQPFEVPDKRILIWENKRLPIEQLRLNADGKTLQLEKPVHWDSRNLMADFPVVLNEDQHHEMERWYKTNVEQQKEKLEKALQPYSLKVKQQVCALFSTMNEATVCTSPILANCLGSNTNATPLGSTVQAKAIMFYLVKYILKDKTKISSTLSVIKYALQKQAKFPSRAQDDQSKERTGIQLLQIILNKLNGLCEIADTQAAAACLGLPAMEFTCHFTFIFIDAAIAAVNMRVLEDEDEHPDLAWEPPRLWKLKMKRKCKRNH